MQSKKSMECDIKLFRRPYPFQSGTITLWSNSYIASNVLKKHLDGTIDSGSRKTIIIEQTVHWIIKKLYDKRRILDIGCGPGLYARVLCENGFTYEGLDISQYQVEYAQRYNNVPGKTTYYVGDFRTWVPDKKYDLVLMLYGVYSFYTPQNRKTFLCRLSRWLNPGACVVVEVFTKKHYENRDESSDWRYVQSDGFWSPNPHLELNAFYRFDDQNLVLVQAGVVEEHTFVWNSWIQVFDVSSLKQEFIDAGFQRFEYYGSCTGEPLTNDSEVLCLFAYLGD